MPPRVRRLASLLAAALASGACAGAGRPAPAGEPAANQGLARLVQPALERMAERYLRVAQQRDPANGIPHNSAPGGAFGRATVTARPA